MTGERQSGFIGFRIHRCIKDQLVKEALDRGENLSAYVFRLIELGWEQINKEDVKHSGESEGV